MVKPTYPKDPVTVRFRPLTRGRQSIYLDIYHNGCRRYEFLHLYLWPVQRGDLAARQHNEQVLKQAMTIKAQRTQTFLQQHYVSLCRQSADVLLTDWMDGVMQAKARNGQSLKRAETFATALRHLTAFLAGRRVRLYEVDKPLLMDFIHYLHTTTGRRGTTLNPSSASLYFAAVVSALQQACCDGLIDENPARRLRAEERKVLKGTGPNHTYLNVDEIKALQMVSPVCGQDTLAAFLFACFTGLRFSDVATLRHSDIKTEDERRYIVKTMVKTRRHIVIPLSACAERWLPRPPAHDDSLVFCLPTFRWVEICLKRMARAAGIAKDLTFHTSRHTFATLQITLGSDLYTVSRLLGHSNIRSTQIYADIVGQKKLEAVCRFDDVF
ncbi:MAG: tyrosine-type recombinase/integrase [Alloprevotella sp.]